MIDEGPLGFGSDEAESSAGESSSEESSSEEEDEEEEEETEGGEEGESAPAAVNGRWLAVSPT